ncbi:MAG: hypothetical protein JJU36_16605 [Phycisphaeraceae bacterium]|nr:hypothetical protein [Phycisphaeraceae bacterium]
MREVFSIELMRGGRVVESASEGGWAKLVQRPVDDPDTATIEYVFDGPDRLRLRGRIQDRALKLVLSTQPEGNIVTHPASPRGGTDAEQAADARGSRGGCWVVNARQSINRFGFEPLVGKLHVDAPWQPMQSKYTRITVEADASGVFDLAIDCFQSTWLPTSRPSFEDCVAAVESLRKAWLDRELTAPDELAEARELAAYVNWSALVEPVGLLTRPTMFMSKVVMDQVWSWDHCFNAMALAATQPDLAWDQLWTVIDHQDAFGAFPDGLNPLFKHYNFSKPPVLGWAMDICRKANPGFFNRDRMLLLYEPLLRWTRWWLEHRTWPGTKLPYYLHGNDSGWDNSTMFDQGVPLVAPDLAALLALQMEMISELALELGKTGESREWRKRSSAMIESLVDELWQRDGFAARRQSDGKLIRSQSLIPLIPLVLGHRLPEAVRQAMLDRLPEFLTPHGLATEQPSSECYEEDGYWRGPIWAPSTFIIFHGLVTMDRRDLAEQVAQRFTRTCARYGMAENFDALEGRALRDTAYTWTSSVFLLLAQWLTGQGPLASPTGWRSSDSLGTDHQQAANAPNP